jgi:hypothetical protein
MLAIKPYAFNIITMFGTNNYLPKVIAITGSKRSGKDTLANYISDRYKYEKIKLAQPIKHCVSELFGWSPHQLEEDEKENIDPKWGISPRKAMQFFGTEIMQYRIQELVPNIDKKFLVKSLINKMDPKKYYVISDLRFYHEYEELKKLNPLIIRIDRPNTPIDDHVSECEYKCIPYHINIINDTKVNDIATKFESSFS